MKRYGIAIGLVLLCLSAGCRQWDEPRYYQPYCYPQPAYCPPCPTSSTTTYAQPTASPCGPVTRQLRQ